MKNHKIVAKKFLLFRYHEYEQWLSEMDVSGWKLKSFQKKDCVEFIENSTEMKRFIILTTRFSRKFYMQDIQHLITKYQYTEFEIPTFLIDTVILYRLQIDEDEYTDLLKQRDRAMLQVLREKIGIPTMLSVLSILVLCYINSVGAVLMLFITIPAMIYYLICYFKYKKCSKGFKK